MPPIISREDAPRPGAPVLNVRSTCSGWSCLNDAEQFGVLFSVIVTVTILGVILFCFRKSWRAERNGRIPLIHVRQPRELRRRYISPVSVIVPPPPTYQPVQVPYGQYVQQGMHIQAPLGTTVQPYVARPVGFTPVAYGQANSHHPPPGFNGPVPNPYHVPQQPVPQLPKGGTLFNGPQPGAYAQGLATGPWDTPTTMHMSAAPQSVEPPKPTLMQRLMRKFSLPMGHASTVTESHPSLRSASRATSPGLVPASRQNSPARRSRRRSTRRVRNAYRRPTRTASARPRRGMRSYRYASPRRRPRSQSPYVYRGTARRRSSRARSSSSSSTSISSRSSRTSTQAVVRGRSRGSDRT